MKATVTMTFECRTEGEITKDILEYAFLDAWQSSVILSEQFDGSDTWAILIDVVSVVSETAKRAGDAAVEAVTA